MSLLLDDGSRVELESLEFMELVRDTKVITLEHVESAFADPAFNRDHLSAKMAKVCDALVSALRNCEEFETKLLSHALADDSSWELLETNFGTLMLREQDEGTSLQLRPFAFFDTRFYLSLGLFVSNLYPDTVNGFTFLEAMLYVIHPKEAKVLTLVGSDAFRYRYYDKFAADVLVIKREEQVEKILESLPESAMPSC